MARDIVNKDKFEFNDIYKKYTGEYLEENLKGLYLNVPRVSLITSSLLLCSSILELNNGSEWFFLTSSSFLFLSALFSYMMYNERANIPLIGAINDSRSSQLKKIFSFLQSKNSDLIKYYVDIGCVVNNFLGKDDKESIKYNLIKKNQKYRVLLGKKIYTMGYLLPGSTGSGKTITLMSSVFIPAIKTGNGFFYIEGKGDRPITEDILAFIYRFGREKDAFILDFGAAATGGFTNGLNPLEIGNAKTVGELLKNLIDIMKGDNKWVSDMAIAFLEAMLLPLVLLRDMNLVINPKDLKSIRTYDDLIEKDHFLFNISTLLNYLNFQAAIDLYYMMNRMFKDKNFLKQVNRIEEYASLKKSLNENITDRLYRNLSGHNIDMTSLIEPEYSKLSADIKRNHPKATEDWINALEIFGSEKYYGNIFNKPSSDFVSLTAIQTGKMIISIIPSMSASREQCEKMGKMLTSCSKASIGYMLEKGDLTGNRRDKRRDKRYRPRKLPYGFVFDEPGNYANEDIAQESSMIRSIGTDNGGMALVWTGQTRTDMDRIDDNKKIESERLLANLGFIQCLNIQDKGWKDFMIEKTGEIYVRREEVYEGGNSKDDKVQIRREKEKKYETNYFENNLRPQTGECIVLMKGNPNEEKVVATYNEAPKTDILLNKNISATNLLNHFKSIEIADKEIQELEETENKKVEKILKKYDGLDKSFEEEVREALVLLGKTAYPDLSNLESFTIKLLEQESKSAHGDYTYATKSIRIYNCINKSREHLIATAIHELSHHIEYLQTGSSGHSKNFYSILHNLLCFAIGLELLDFDYAEAKAKNLLDANDLRMCEKHFGIPIGRKI